MIQSQSIVDILDNSGIKSVKCVGIYKKSPKNAGKVGVIFIGVVKKFKKKNPNKKKYKRGSLVKCMFICSKKENQFKSSGLFLKHLTKNGAILVNSQAIHKEDLKPLGSRYEGFLPLTCFKSPIFKMANFNKYIL
jgi:ribosomal protein L14